MVEEVKGSHVEILNDNEGKIEKQTKIIPRERIIQKDIGKKLDAIINKNVTAENITSEEVTTENINEASDFMRWIFAHDYPEYAYCVDCDMTLPHGKRVSVRDALDMQSDEYISLNQLSNPINLPDCDDCGNQMELFFDENASYKSFEDKFKEDAGMTLLRNDNKEVVGLNFAYMRSLREVFKKEWEDYYLYAAKETKPEAKRSLDNFLDKVLPVMKNLETELGGDPDQVTPEIPIICSNLIAIDPRYRRQRHTFALLLNSFEMVPEDMLKNGFGISESIRGTLMHELCLAAGGKEVAGVFQDEKIDLNDEDYVIMVFKFSQYQEAFC